jgi:hypothetical protein
MRIAAIVHAPELIMYRTKPHPENGRWSAIRTAPSIPQTLPDHFRAIRSLDGVWGLEGDSSEEIAPIHHAAL